MDKNKNLLPEDITGGVNANTLTTNFIQILVDHYQQSANKFIYYEDALKELDALQITEQTEVTETPAIVQINGVRVFSRGDVSSIIGAAKSRKTLFVSAICRDILQQCNNNIVTSEIMPRVLYIDTEQSILHAKRTYDRITYNFTQEERARLQYIPLRDKSPLKRLLITGAAIEEYKPDLVIIDGLTDLQTNVNDLEEAAIIVGILMAVATTYNCHITNIIHTTNQNAQKARGHLGSELERKCESVILVERDKNDETKTRSFIKPTYTRNKPFTDLTISHTETGYILQEAQTQRNAKEDIRIKIIAKAIKDAAKKFRDAKSFEIAKYDFRQKMEYAYFEIKESTPTKRTIDNYIKFAKDNGYIAQADGQNGQNSYYIGDWQDKIKDCNNE